MQISATLTRDKILPALVVAPFAAFVIMLPRYTDTARTWFALLILIAIVYLVFYLARKVPAWKKMVNAGVILALIASSFAIPMVGERVAEMEKSIDSYYASDDYRDAAL